jgi:hypothetical protein
MRSPPTGIVVRLATPEDDTAIAALIAESSRTLLRPFYTAAQIEAALQGTFGVDRSLIEDGTYFVAEDEGRIVGCGGWDRRARVFGASGDESAPPPPLDPADEEPVRYDMGGGMFIDFVRMSKPL